MDSNDKKVYLIIHLIICILLTSCDSYGFNNVIRHYPECADFDESIESSDLVPNPISTPSLLSNGLILEKYDGEFIWPHKEERGCMFSWGRVVDIDKSTRIILDNSFHVIVSPSNEKNEELVEVFKNGHKEFSTSVHEYVYSGLLSAWGFSDHWCIEIIETSAKEIVEEPVINSGDLHKQQEDIRKHIDIICDGKSLKEENSYESLFSFQTLNNKPFYFFISDGNYGISYDGNETLIDYESISWMIPHPGLESFIYHFENMVVFYAYDGTQSYEVVLSNFME